MASRDVPLVIWMILGLAGLLITGRNLHEARCDLLSIEELNGKNISHAAEMRILAMGHVRAEIVRILKCIVVLSVGVIAFLFPSPRPGPVTAAGAVVTIGLILLVALIVTQSFLDSQMRRDLKSWESKYRE